MLMRDSLPILLAYLTLRLTIASYYSYYSYSSYYWYYRYYRYYSYYSYYRYYRYYSFYRTNSDGRWPGTFWAVLHQVLPVNWI